MSTPKEMFKIRGAVIIRGVVIIIGWSQSEGQL